MSRRMCVSLKMVRKMKKRDYDALSASLTKLHKQMLRTVRVMAIAVDDEQHPNVIQLAGAANMISDWIRSVKDEYQQYKEQIDS